MAKIVDISAPKGYEVEETTAAKDIVWDHLYEMLGDWGIDTGDGEPINPKGDAIFVADAIVEALIAGGWRPTEED